MRPAPPRPSLAPCPTELVEFRARQRRGSPHYTVYLGFGQDLSAGRPKDRSLVLVKVRRRVPLGGGRRRGGLTAPSPQLEPWLCRAYLESVQREGVSSLDSSSFGSALSSANSLYEDLERFLEHYLMEVEQPA